MVSMEPSIIDLQFFLNDPNWRKWQTVLSQRCTSTACPIYFVVMIDTWMSTSLWEKFKQYFTVYKKLFLIITACILYENFSDYAHYQLTHYLRSGYFWNHIFAQNHFSVFLLERYRSRTVSSNFNRVFLVDSRKYYQKQKEFQFGLLSNALSETMILVEECLTTCNKKLYGSFTSIATCERIFRVV